MGVSLCLIPSMFQPDLFAAQTEAEPASPAPAPPQDLPGVLELLASVCTRPRYSYMVLSLIVQASSQSGSAGPYVRVGERNIPIRTWLCDALMPTAQRDPRRKAVARSVLEELQAQGDLPKDQAGIDKMVEEQVFLRIRRSGLSNVSRAVSELVRAGLVRRHYQGFRVDHHNRGARRQAVYTVTDEARRALG